MRILSKKNQIFIITIIIFSELASTQGGSIVRPSDEKLPMITHMKKQPRYESNLIFRKKVKCNLAIIARLSQSLLPSNQNPQQKTYPITGN